MNLVRLCLGAMLVLVACAPAPTVAPTREAQTLRLLPEEPVPFSTATWKTDFKKHSVPYKEILSCGPSKDGIPALDEPKFVAPHAARAWLAANEPVIVFAHQNDARAYPLQI